MIDIITGTYTVKRYSAGAWGADGRFSRGVESSFEIKASIQPVDGNQIKILPEHRRNKESIMIFSDERLFTSNEASGKPADIIEYDGKSFEVFKVQKWAGVTDINHYETMAVMQDGESSPEVAAPTYAVENGFSLDGINKGFSGNIQNGFSGQKNISVEVIIKFDMTQNGNGYIWSWYDESESQRFYLFWINSRFRLYVGENNYYVDAAPTRANKVYHIVCTYDGDGASDTDKAKIYVDGVNETIASTGALPVALPDVFNEPLTVGYRNDNQTGGYMENETYSLNIFTRTLTPSEISDLYNSGNFGAPVDAQHSWWFGDNENDTPSLIIDNEGDSNLTGENLVEGDRVTI